MQLLKPAVILGTRYAAGCDIDCTAETAEAGYKQHARTVIRAKIEENTGRDHASQTGVALDAVQLVLVTLHDLSTAKDADELWSKLAALRPTLAPIEGVTMPYQTKTGGAVAVVGDVVGLAHAL